MQGLTIKDIDLLVGEMFNNNRRFSSIHNCDVKYPVFDQRYNEDVQEIIIAATGATKDEFDVTVMEDILIVKRQNKKPEIDISKTTKYEYSHTGISRKNFEIPFRVPKMWDTDNISVKLENGELTISIPRKEETKPKVKTFSIL